MVAWRSFRDGKIRFNGFAISMIGVHRMKRDFLVPSKTLHCYATRIQEQIYGRSESSHETKQLNVRMTSVQCWYKLSDKVHGDPRRRLNLDVSEPCAWTRLRSKGGVMFSNNNHFGEPPHGILLQSFARGRRGPRHNIRGTRNMIKNASTTGDFSCHI